MPRILRVRADWRAGAGVADPNEQEGKEMLGRLGLISSSSFYVPQVNLTGSMASFVTPAGIPVVAPPPAKLKGLGQDLVPAEGVPAAGSPFDFSSLLSCAEFSCIPWLLI